MRKVVSALLITLLVPTTAAAEGIRSLRIELTSEACHSSPLQRMTTPAQQSSEQSYRFLRCHLQHAEEKPSHWHGDAMAWLSVGTPKTGTRMIGLGLQWRDKNSTTQFRLRGRRLYFGYQERW